MSKKVTHLTLRVNSYRAFCNMPVRGFSRGRRPLMTEDPSEVTCKNCFKAGRKLRNILNSLEVADKIIFDGEKFARHRQDHSSLVSTWKKQEPLFPERLREARELRGLSQGDLADRAGLQPSAISHFETGGRKPSFENLRRLADALSVSTDYLLGRRDEPGAVGGEAEALYKDLENATVEDQQFIRDILATRRKRKQEDK